MTNESIVSGMIKRLTMLAIVVSTLTVFGLAQRTISLSIDAGKEKDFRLPIDLNRNSLRYTIEPQELASIRYDTNDTFWVKGETPGEGTITVRGTQNSIDAAGKAKELPFTRTVAIQVLPRRDIDSLTRPITVGKGPRAAKVLTVGYIMSPGQDFANVNAEGISWRQLTFVGGDRSVAEGELFEERNVKKFRITGIRDGKTTLKLLGQRRVGNTWQSVERNLSITVGTGRPPKSAVGDANDDAGADPAEVVPANIDGRTKIVEAIERSFANTKRQIGRSGYDENEAARLLNEIEALIVLVDQELAKEQNIDALGPRWLKLQNIKNLAEIERRSLKDMLAKKSKRSKNLEILWRDTPDSLQFGEQIGKRFTLVCPSFPGGAMPNGLFIFGTGPFSGSSGICTSAVYSGHITSTGGEVTIEIVALEQQYNGTTNYEDAPRYIKNGVQAYSWPNKLFGSMPPPRSSFIFVK